MSNNKLPDGLPAPAKGFLVATFLTVRSIARSRDFYARVLGGRLFSMRIHA